MREARQATGDGAVAPRELSQQLWEAHDRFLGTGRAGRVGGSGGVRPLVAASWRRCLDGGLDPERSLAPVDLLDGELEQWRAGHPLASALPVIRRLLVDYATDAGLLVAVSDAAGRLLWVEGQTALRSRAERIHFVEGADWSEEHAGTNAPGTALALDQPVRIFTAEHLARPVTPWSCSAAPIHDLDTGAVLGALDLTGGDDVASSHALSLVRATVAAVEGELRLQRLLASEPLRSRLPALHRPPDEPELAVLGRDAALLQREDDVTRLSLRHSELMLLLTAAPDGRTGEQLSLALHEHDLAAVTLRAELSRLRGVLGQDALLSRPYRLARPPASDWAQVRSLLTQGRLGEAVDRYRGPVLPLSDAPSIRELRRDLHETLRRALLRAGDPDALLRFADTDHGRHDEQVWRAAAAALPPTSPRRAQVEAHLAWLGAELGTGIPRSAS